MSTILDGYLEKKKAGGLLSAFGLGGNYVRRWFTLTPDRLSYSNSIKDKAPSGVYELRALKYLKRVSPTEFEVGFPQRNLLLRAQDGSESQRWHDTLERAYRDARPLNASYASSSAPQASPVSAAVISKERAHIAIPELRSPSKSERTLKSAFDGGFKHSPRGLRGDAQTEVTRFVVTPDTADSSRGASKSGADQPLASTTASGGGVAADVEWLETDWDDHDVMAPHDRHHQILTQPTRAPDGGGRKHPALARKPSVKDQGWSGEANGRIGSPQKPPPPPSLATDFVRPLTPLPPATPPSDTKPPPHRGPPSPGVPTDPHWLEEDWDTEEVLAMA